MFQWRNSGKTPIFIIAMLAVIGIIAYRITEKPGGNNNIKSSFILPYIYINNRFFSYGAAAVDFTLGQKAPKTTTVNGNTIQAEKNLGVYVETLDEINIIGANLDVAFIFIPGPDNELIDDNTKKAILEIQRGLEKSSTTAGLFTLWHDSLDYSEITKQTKTPAIIIARNGKGTITMPGSKLNEYMLYQAYLKAGTKGCCEYYVPGCC